MLADIERHTTGNRQEIEAGDYAGCISCCAVFGAKEVHVWRDEWTGPAKRNREKRWTAQCPRCGEHTVIGSSTGLPEDQGYLPIARLFLDKNVQG